MQTEETPIRVLMVLAEQACMLTLFSVDLILAYLLLALVSSTLASVSQARDNALTLNLLLQIGKFNVLNLVSVEVSLKEASHAVDTLLLLRVH